jgi:hypothetical protein
MWSRRACVGIAAIVLTVSSSRSSGQGTTSPPIPVREVTAPLAASKERFGLILTARGISDGSVFVNDPRRRQILLLDSTLALKSVAFDSTDGAEQRYSRGYAPFFPFLGDSSLLVDSGAQSLLVVGPNGKIARVMAAPFPEHMSRLATCCTWSDAQGNLIYNVYEKVPSLNAAAASQDTVAIRRAFNPSAAGYIVRANFASRQLDTLGRLVFGEEERSSIVLDGGRITMKTFVDPYPRTDDFAVLADGSLMIVRGQDYHVDIVRPSLDKSQGPKIPFNWQPITDEQKQTILDSLKVRQARSQQALQELNASIAGAPSSRPASSGGGAGAAATAGGLGGGVSRPSPSSQPDIRFERGVLRADQIADYLPPIRRNGSKADMDGNLWILPTTSAQSRNGELVYDVVNRDGILTHRVRLPEGRSIVGFGKNGVLLLASPVEKSWLLERVRIKPM